MSGAVVSITNEPAQLVRERVTAIDKEIETHTRRIEVLTEFRDELMELVTKMERRPTTTRPRARSTRPTDLPGLTRDAEPNDEPPGSAA